MPSGILKVLRQLDMEPEHFEACHDVLKQTLVLLNYNNRGIPTFTDHGPNHTLGVLKFIVEIKNQYPVLLSSEDKMILAIAAIFHDTGCIKERDNHNERSVLIVKMPQFSIVRGVLTREAYRFLQHVIRAHSSVFDLLTLRNDGTNDSRLPVLCCLFRLADECDISSNRIPILILEIMQKFKVLSRKSLNIWKSHLEIEKIYLEGTKVIVQAYDEKKAKHWLKKLNKETKIISKVLVSYDKPRITVEPKIVPRPL